MVTSHHPAPFPLVTHPSADHSLSVIAAVKWFKAPGDGVPPYSDQDLKDRLRPGTCCRQFGRAMQELDSPSA